jgi:hypothetical protein
VSYKPNIWFFSPYCESHKGRPDVQGRDLGLKYNEYADLVTDPMDWICFSDSDAMPCGKYWERLLEKAIIDNPAAGAFVPMTGGLIERRSGWQMIPEFRHHYDVTEWWNYAQDAFQVHGARAVDFTDIDLGGTGKNKQVPFSGVAFCFQKQTWVDMGGAPEGMWTGCDHAIHRGIRDTGRRIYLLPGWVVFHWGMDFRHTALNDPPETMGGEEWQRA